MEYTGPETLAIGQPEAKATTRRSGHSWRNIKDNIAGRGLFVAALLLILLLITIGALLTIQALPILRTVSLKDLTTSLDWHPQNGAFGLAPFIVGSFAVTLVAMMIGVVPAVLSGMFLAEYTTARRRTLFKPVLDLLAGIPSVVYGLWGVLFVVPLIREVMAPALGATLGQRFPVFAATNPSGYSVLAGGIVLAIMIFPLIVSVTDEVLRNIPHQLRESSLALGATKWEATWCVVRYGGLPGVFASVVLAFSRAFGETLAVVMVVGNTPQFPRSIFDAAYPLPALIANAYGEMMSVPLYQSALMLAALVLMLIILCFNIVARLAIVRMTKGE